MGDIGNYAKVDSICKTLLRRKSSVQSFRQSHDHFILLVGTDDLKSEKSCKTTAKQFLNVAVSLKTEAHGVSISNIFRRHNQRLNLKVVEGNNHLAGFVGRWIFPWLIIWNELKHSIFNYSRLLLNKSVSKVLEICIAKKVLRDMHLAIQVLIKIILMICFRLMREIVVSMFWNIYRWITEVN